MRYIRYALGIVALAFGVVVLGAAFASSSYGHHEDDHATCPPGWNDTSVGNMKFCGRTGKSVTATNAWAEYESIKTAVTTYKRNNDFAGDACPPGWLHRDGRCGRRRWAANLITDTDYRNEHFVSDQGSYLRVFDPTHAWNMYRIQDQAVESSIARDYPNASDSFKNSLRRRKHGNYDTIRQLCERYNGSLSESGGQCSYTPD